MKKFLTFVLLIITMLCTSCEIKPVQPLDETPVQVDTLQELSNNIGFEMAVPKDARNIKYSVINGLIGEIEFTYNSIIFTLRASKMYSEAALYGIADKPKQVDSFEIDDVEVLVYTLDNEDRLALCYNSGTNYSIYTQKIVGTDVLTTIAKEVIH